MHGFERLWSHKQVHLWISDTVESVHRNQALIICLRALTFRVTSWWMDKVGPFFSTHVLLSIYTDRAVFAMSTAFPRTLHHLFLHPPVTVLVPDNALASSVVTRPGARTYRSSHPTTRDEPSLLVQCIEAKAGLQCQAVPRLHWNREEGRLGVPLAIEPGHVC